MNKTFLCYLMGHIPSGLLSSHNSVSYINSILNLSNKKAQFLLELHLIAEIVFIKLGTAYPTYQFSLYSSKIFNRLPIFGYCFK